MLHRLFERLYAYTCWFIFNYTHFFFLRYYLALLKLWSSRSPLSSFPKVSIIIATYNRSSILIGRTIPALLRQSYRNFEVIVIGDCCIDSTPSDIIPLLQSDTRLKFYNLKRRSQYPSLKKNGWFVHGVCPRNVGIKLASGDLLCYLSDDDIVFPDYLSVLVTGIQRSGTDFFSASALGYKQGSYTPIRPSRFNYRSQLVCGPMQAWIYRSYLSFFRWSPYSWAKFHDRPCDYDLQHRMYSCGVSFSHCDTLVAISPPLESTNDSGYSAYLRLLP